LAVGCARADRDAGYNKNRFLQKSNAMAEMAKSVTGVTAFS
jgi:hypothetical protein